MRRLLFDPLVALTFANVHIYIRCDAELFNADVDPINNFLWFSLILRLRVDDGVSVLLA